MHSYSQMKDPLPDVKLINKNSDDSVQIVNVKGKIIEIVIGTVGNSGTYIPKWDKVPEVSERLLFAYNNCPKKLV